MNQENLPFCCGVDDVGDFGNYRRWRSGRNGQVQGRTPVERSGTGLFTATFVNNAGCRNAYEALTQEHTLLFQSKPKENGNSGREVFLCVFQYRQDDGNLPVL